MVLSKCGQHIIMLINILVGGACNVVSGFVGSAAHLSCMVISGVVILVSDSVSLLLMIWHLRISGLRVGTILHGINDSFHYGGNVWSFVGFSLLLCLVGKDLLILLECLSFFPDLGIISIISIVTDPAVPVVWRVRTSFYVILHMHYSNWYPPSMVQRR